MKYSIDSNNSKEGSMSVFSLQLTNQIPEITNPNSDEIIKLVGLNLITVCKYINTTHICKTTSKYFSKESSVDKVYFEIIYNDESNFRRFTILPN